MAEEFDLSRFPPVVAEFYEAASAKLEGVPMAGGDLTFKGVESTKDFADADIAVVGCPYDLGVSFRPGARFGPRAVRELSRYVGAWPTGVWPWHYDVRDEYRMVDWGDIGFVVGYWDSFAMRAWRRYGPCTRRGCRSSRWVAITTSPTR